MSIYNKSRRDFLVGAGAGIGALSLGSALGIQSAYASELAAAAGLHDAVDPLAPRAPHFSPKAKAVIWLHMAGAPSTIDLFDHKPDIAKLSGQEVPASFLKGVRTTTQGGVGKILETGRTWKQHGDSGAWFSDLLPNLAKQADDIAFIKSSVTIGATHNISILKLNTGALTPGRPTLGAWVQYALGSNNPDLPAYVVLSNGGRGLEGGAAVNYGAGFLPAVYQGTPFQQGDSPILYLNRPELVSEADQRNSLDLLKTLNQYKAKRYPGDSELRARIEANELAYRMEKSAAEAVDLKDESQATKELYGIGVTETNAYGTNLLRARRLVERGTRFVQVVSGESGGFKDWDAHNDAKGNNAAMARMVDKPVAALLADLKARGLLESTLVVWASEFGRTAYSQSGDGRDHNPWGYTQWLAGGGSKAGTTVGQTDDIGLQSVSELTVDTYDLQATVLQLLGLDHLKVTYLSNGRSERPTVVYGKVIKELIA
jgi:hypothetical protein